MSANRKPRKAYRGPKGFAGSLPMVYGMDRTMKTELRLTPHLILEGFKAGHGDDDGIHTLASCLWIGEVIARAQEPDDHAVMRAGLVALTEVKARGDAGCWTLRGDEIRIIGEAINRSDELQDRVTRKDVRNAIQTVWKETA